MNDTFVLLCILLSCFDFSRASLQKMEDEYEAFAKEMEGKIDVYSFRGDDQREFVMENLNTSSFPTVDVITPDGKAIKYDSEVRTVDAFKAFVDETVGEAVA